MRHLAILCAVLGLGGCALIHDTGMNLVATTVPAHAAINAEAFSGTAMLHVDRTGTLHLASTSRPDITCVGRLRYTATTQGVIHLQCSDGNKASLNFSALQEAVGHASGAAATGPINLTFGMEEEMAAAYLGPRDKAPAGRPETPARR